MSVPLGDAGFDSGSVKQLDVQGFSRSLPGAFPIKVVVADQAQFGFQFGSNQSESSFRPGRSNGADEDGPGVGLRALGIRQDTPAPILINGHARPPAAQWDGFRAG